VFSSSSESDPDEPEGVAVNPPSSSSTPVVAAIKSKPIVTAVKSGKTECCHICDRFYTKKGLKLHLLRYHKLDDDKKQEEEDGGDDDEEEEERRDKEDGASSKKVGKKEPKQQAKQQRRSSSGRERKNPPLKKLFACAFCHKRFSHLASMKVRKKEYFFHFERM
jgi:hypothetical protein